MKKILRVGVVLVVILALAALAYIVLGPSGFGATSAEEEAPTATVTRGSIEELVGASGSVIASRQASLTFKSSGPIQDLLVNKGQEVEQGQVLARLDTASIEWQIARAEASLETARARLEQVKRPASAQEIASAQAALDSAQANRENIMAGASTEDVASARAALDSATANYAKVAAGPTAEDLAAARAQVESARAQVAQAQAAYDRVKGQPDIQMRPESLSLQTATISLEQAQANYDALASRPTAAELAAAEAQVAQAQAQLATLSNTPASQLAAAEAQVAQAQASLDALLSRPNADDIAVQEAQIQEAALSLAQTQSQLEDTLLTAPFAGTILAVNVNEGEWASPGAPAIVLAATQSLILSANVDEVDVAQIVEGQPVSLSFDALRGEKLFGTVIYIAPSSTNVSGAVAYGLEIGFEPGDLAVRLGMTADVDIITASRDDALLVPNQAIEADREAGRYYVTLQKADGTQERREVSIGLRDQIDTEIVAGLEEGDLVVLPQIPGQSQDNQRFGSGPGRGPFHGQ